MKRVKLSNILKTCALSLAVMLFCLMPSLTASAEYIDNEPYVFELQPDTAEWAAYDEKADKLARLQIPEGKLSSMTTNALLETVMNYPYILDYTAFNSVQGAYDTFSSDFNGFRELMQRKDLSNTLLHNYEKTKPATKNFRSVADPTEFFKTSTFEFLICSDVIENGEYTGADAEKLKTLTKEKSEAKLFSGLYSATSNVYTGFAADMGLSSDSLITPMAGENAYAGSVKTPKGTTVQTLYDRFPELTSVEKTNTNTYYGSIYPNAVRLAQPTVKYNCHSYAWYSQSTSNKHWMNVPNAYWNDGSYAKLAILPRVGHKAHWPTGDHSAVVSKITYQNGTHYYYYTSKWGAAGLYEHFTSDCPYTGSVVNYEKK